MSEALEHVNKGARPPPLAPPAELPAPREVLRQVVGGSGDWRGTAGGDSSLVRFRLRLTATDFVGRLVRFSRDGLDESTTMINYISGD